MFNLKGATFIVKVGNFIEMVFIIFFFIKNKLTISLHKNNRS